MNIQTFLIVGLAVGLVGCAEKDRAASQPMEKAATPATATTEAAAVPTIERGNPEFIEHMHRHADYLDELNLALAEGDIVAAMTPAYWLSRHDSVEGVPEDWQPYIKAMHAAAMDVEQATNIDDAKAAAERITAQCQSCHAAAGVLGEQLPTK
jgi:hypothetical protein